MWVFLFSEFHRLASLPHSFTSYFVNLISNIKKPSFLDELGRLILLVEFHYKLVPKV